MSIDSQGLDVSPDRFVEYFVHAFAAMTAEPGRPRRFPSKFALATARCVFEAARRATANLDHPLASVTGLVRIQPPRYHMVSAPTGGGKTLTACALMAYLHPTPSAFVTKLYAFLSAFHSPTLLRSIGSAWDEPITIAYSSAPILFCG